MLLGLSADRVNSRQASDQVLNALLSWCLNTGHKGWAAELLWTPNLFTPEPKATQLVWSAFEENSSILLQGAASMSKSYGAGVWLMLDWLRDPEYTTVRVVGPSEGHLRENLFTHLVTLHRSAAIKLPGEVLDLFIGLDPRARKSAISGIVIPIGKKAGGKLQGGKRVQRPHPHPIFGPLTRMRVFIDEMENVQESLWKDMDNIMSQVEGIESFKIAGAYNPRDINSKVAERAEPEGGWENGFDMETSETWVSKRGWKVVRLDAMKCENVVSGKVIYPGLQTREGIEATIRDQGGINTPGYYAMVRAAYPPAGVSTSIIQQLPIKAEVVFLGKPAPAAAVDVALTGKAAPIMAVGRFGKAASYRIPPCLAHPKGAEIFFTGKSGRKEPRNVLAVDTLFTLPMDKTEKPTIALALSIKKFCESFGVNPELFVLDKTGNGAGVLDVLSTIWSRKVRGVNYSENPSGLKILEEDLEKSDVRFDRIASELWWALKAWSEHQFLFISPMADTKDLFHQISDRREIPAGKKKKAEPKPAYKDRNGGVSPDEADAVTLLVHAVRIGTGFIPSVVGPGIAVGDDFDEGLEPLCDITNQIDVL